MAAKKLSFAIIGAGVDGLTVAATLCRAGFNVQVYEQAACFECVGAISSANTWMKGGDGETSWLNGYDAGNVALATMEPDIQTV